jgi:hypothetical protein
MIDLNDENDPMLFAVSLPNGKLIVQYMEVVATIQATAVPGAEPSPQVVIDAIRKASRTPEVAMGAMDAWLIAAWHRMTMRMDAAGKG